MVLDGIVAAAYQLSAKAGPFVRCQFLHKEEHHVLLCAPRASFEQRVHLTEPALSTLLPVPSRDFKGDFVPHVRAILLNSDKHLLILLHVPTFFHMLIRFCCREIAYDRL